MQHIKAAQSYLFVPGQRPDRFAKAAASGADEIILDLEDAVGPDMKDQARANILDWFAQGGTGIVRINSHDAPWYCDDLAALRDSQCTALMVPKADPISLARVAAEAPDKPLIALVETAAGIAGLRDSIMQRGVTRLAFGNLDFGADMRLPAGGSVLDHARYEIVLASRLGNLPRPIDGVTTDLKSTSAITADVQHARALGFGAKLCIHPAQISAVAQGFFPAPIEIDWATRLLTALKDAAGAAVQIDGKMVDKPLIDRARQILQDAEVTG
ncbi:MAG: CoA ester lyase [Rhodobacteraceae bacterium]|nr:CoA ester lyase [Paracoccaceae bacterium]PHR54054.1 MAG: CoA ester lyase [Robiginitomaculum sp.]